MNSSVHRKVEYLTVASPFWTLSERDVSFCRRTFRRFFDCVFLRFDSISVSSSFKTIILPSLKLKSKSFLFTSKIREKKNHYFSLFSFRNFKPDTTSNRRSDNKFQRIPLGRAGRFCTRITSVGVTIKSTGTSYSVNNSFGSVSVTWRKKFKKNYFYKYLIRKLPQLLQTCSSWTVVTISVFSVTAPISDKMPKSKSTYPFPLPMRWPDLDTTTEPTTNISNGTTSSISN